MWRNMDKFKQDLEVLGDLNTVKAFKSFSFCPDGKHKYSKKEAQTALNRVKQKHRRHDYRKECRVYHCPRCNGWHLTSKGGD
jgi:uncharacterized protein with PIN domain